VLYRRQTTFQRTGSIYRLSYELIGRFVTSAGNTARPCKSGSHVQYCTGRRSMESVLGGTLSVRTEGVVHFIEVILVHVARSYPSLDASDCLWWPDIHYPCLVELKLIIQHWFPKVVRPRNRVSDQVRLVAVRMISARGYQFLSSTKSAQYELMA
jgi:hypothetical protein